MSPGTVEVNTSDRIPIRGLDARIEGGRHSALEYNGLLRDTPDEAFGRGQAHALESGAPLWPLALGFPDYQI
jgi:hypothetical protein